MRTNDSLKPKDQVTVTITGPDEQHLYQATNAGFHSIEDAVSQAITHARLSINPEDCVFTVANDTTAVTHRYRLNAHGNIKLII